MIQLGNRRLQKFLGNDAFIERLERLLDQPLKPGMPDPNMVDKKVSLEILAVASPCLSRRKQKRPPDLLPDLLKWGEDHSLS
jgi:hypothetical protein